MSRNGATGTEGPEPFNTELWQAVLQSQKPAEFRAGDILVHQGSDGNSAYVLAEGTVRIFAETLYGPVVLATSHAPCLIGEIGAFAGLPRTASVEAISDAKAYRIDRATLLDIGRRNPGLMLSVIGQLGRQLDGVNRAISICTNAIAALERREFDSRILDELANPSPQVFEFAATFRQFANQIVDKRRRQDELAAAASLQQSFLPKLSSLRDIEGDLDLHAEMYPAREVGGDFYDFFMLDQDRLAIAIGDVCGKGMPACLFMAVVMTVLRTEARRDTDVASTIARINDALCRDNATSMFATAFYGVLDLRSGELEYCNCGHNSPVYLPGGGAPQHLAATGLPLGLFPNRSAAAARISLGASDTLVLFTDGVTEAMSASEEEYGEDRFIATLAALRQLQAAQLVLGVMQDVGSFAQGAEQSDDITCIAIRRRAKT